MLFFFKVAAAAALANYTFLLLQGVETNDGVAELGPREDAIKAVIEVYIGIFVLF